MTALLIGYARVSTDAQDLTAPRDWMLALGVAPGRLYVDHGLTGANRVDLPPHRTAPSARTADVPGRHRRTGRGAARR